MTDDHSRGGVLGPDRARGPTPVGGGEGKGGDERRTTTPGVWSPGTREDTRAYPCRRWGGEEGGDEG